MSAFVIAEKCATLLICGYKRRDAKANVDHHEVVIKYSQMQHIDL